MDCVIMSTLFIFIIRNFGLFGVLLRKLPLVNVILILL